MAYRTRVHVGASEDRLEKLLQERLQPGADRDTIDARIWDLFGETWAVMFTDLAGFSRAVAEFGIIHFLQMIQEAQRVLIPRIEAHDGILLKVEGDSFMVIFRNVDKALACSIDMQQTLVTYNSDKSDVDSVLLCVGLGFGRMLRIGDADVFGAEVNAAAKLGEDTAGPWEILVTEAVRDAAAAVEGVQFQPLESAPAGVDAAFRVDYSR